MAFIRVGTRASVLARAQSELVADLWRRRGHAVELVAMATHGDQVLDRALNQIGQKGVFTEELERALASGAVDVAVHSLKDLPTQLGPGLTIAAYTHPADPRDVLIAKERHLSDLPAGAVVGTSSLRRTAFLRAYRSDLTIVPIRGNLKTRIDKWQSGAVDALVLAAAGVHRMGWESLISEYLDPEMMVPSPGQGVLAVEMAEHRIDLAAIVQEVNDQDTEVLAQAERAVLNELGGGCQVPLGARAQWVGADRVRIVAQVASFDGRTVLTKSVECDRTEALTQGQAIGRHLRGQGALKLIQTAKG